MSTPKFLKILFLVSTIAPLGVPGVMAQKEAVRYPEPLSLSGQSKFEPLREPVDEQASVDRESGGEGRYLLPEPWFSANGERVVAAVEHVTMTQPELDLKVNLALRGLPPVRHPDPKRQREAELERRNEFGKKILEDWVMNQALVLEASSRGYVVTDSEVDAALAQLDEGEGGDSVERKRAIAMVGIPEEQFRREAREGLLIEKYIMEVVRTSYSEDKYRELFEAERSAYLIPPSVHGYHIYRALDRTMTDKQRKDAMKEMEKLRKLLRKRDPDYEELTHMTNPDIGLAAMDMGWTRGDIQRSLGEFESMPDELYNTLFSLDVGDTSDVFADRNGGLHLVRVLERKEGSPMTFEAAKPQIENALFFATKLRTYEALKYKYEISYSPEGLKKWRSVSRDEYLRRTNQAPIRSASTTEGPRQSLADAPLPSFDPEPAKPTGPAIDLSILPDPPSQ